METVFIVYESDQNDETRIIRVFSDYLKAKSFKKELLESGSYDRVFIDAWEVWK